MRIILIVMTLAISYSHSLVASDLATAAIAGKENFKRCIACHLADGAGIPGAFPKLRGRLAQIVQHKGGRDYLTMVVANGLTGAITVQGQPYMGVMPAQSYGLDNKQLAALLNQAIVATAGTLDVSEIRPFSETEISKIKASYKNSSMQHSRSLRPSNLE